MGVAMVKLRAFSWLWLASPFLFVGIPAMIEVEEPAAKVAPAVTFAVFLVVLISKLFDYVVIDDDLLIIRNGFGRTVVHRSAIRGLTHGRSRSQVGIELVNGRSIPVAVAGTAFPSRRREIEEILGGWIARGGKRVHDGVARAGNG